MTNTDVCIQHNCVCCGSTRIQSSPAILMPFIAHRAFGWQPVVIDENWGLSSVKMGNAYSICNTLSCDECGLIFLDIRFSDDQLNNLYHDYRGDDYTNLRDQYEPGYRQQNISLHNQIPYLDKIERFLEPYIKFPLKILDWGGDTGLNTPFFDRASSVNVYDISGKPVIRGVQKLKKFELAKLSFDLIVCSNVLEHVPYPAQLLAEIKLHMTNETVLYIEVPREALITEGDLNAFKRKRHWHEHINFFTEASLRILLQSLEIKLIAFDTVDTIVGEKSVSLFQIACIKL